MWSLTRPTHVHCALFHPAGLQYRSSIDVFANPLAKGLFIGNIKINIGEKLNHCRCSSCLFIYHLLLIIFGLRTNEMVNRLVDGIAVSVEEIENVEQVNCFNHNFPPVVDNLTWLMIEIGVNNRSIQMNIYFRFISPEDLLNECKWYGQSLIIFDMDCGYAMHARIFLVP